MLLKNHLVAIQNGFFPAKKYIKKTERVEPQG